MTALLRAQNLNRTHDALIFGSGTLGSAVTRSLLRLGMLHTAHFAIPWENPPARLSALHDVIRFLSLQSCGDSCSLSVIWAAGRAGFSATPRDASNELSVYADVLNFLKSASRLLSSHTTSFHLISSAGGLYEGQNVSELSKAPLPRRTYGVLKLIQEERTVAILADWSVHIHRPSSVYTLPGQGERLGLISTLVKNGLSHCTTTIFGGLDTLRDFVTASDVGAYVARQVMEDESGIQGVHMLVSAQPTSILEAIKTVESVIRRRLYVNIAESWNAQDITFSPTVKADNFECTPLRVGIKRVYISALGR